jgi:hypothetical protein
VSEGIRRWVKDLIPLLSALLLTYAGWMLIQELRMPPQTIVSAPANMPVVSTLPIASPIVVNFPSEMVVIQATEIPPTPTLPPYVMSTKPADLICGEWVKRGSVCTMDDWPETPTPTPPKCPTIADEECIWTGRKSDAVPVLPPPPPTVPTTPAHE